MACHLLGDKPLSIYWVLTIMMKAPVIFIPHGGGPMPLLGEPNHLPLVNFLQNLAVSLTKPKAIIIISAHWETDLATVTSGAKPDLIYDYSGFPKESYEIKYPVAGHTELAHKVEALIQASGMKAKTDFHRGLDHGVFVPLKLMYPNADVSVVQLSLLNSLDAKKHIELGKSLGQLCDDGIMIIGSGFSFHNMNAFMKNDSNNQSRSLEFDTWLNQILLSDELSFKQKQDALTHWEQGPQARFCHPREEHLLPLHVCFGAATAANLTARNVFDERLLGV